MKKDLPEKIGVHQCLSVAKTCFVLGLFFLAAELTFAADRATEDDMFGGAAASKTESAKATPTPNAGEDSRGFNNDAPHKSTEEALQIGGTLSTEADLFIQEGVPFFDNTTSNPNILFLYADAKLDNDARVLAKGRLFYDPTGVSGGGAGSLTNPYGFGTGNSDNLSASLQELKFSANIDHQLFFTFGRQKVKYGAAKFFNPTDFLNPTPLNFFMTADERPGVDMVKMHIPSGTANFYAAGLVGNPTTGAQSGGYFRAEIAYDGIKDLLGSGEMSFSGFLPKSQGPQAVFDLTKVAKAGFDLSQAVGDLDLYFEGAAGQLSTGEWKTPFSVGGTWEIRYADRGSNTLSLQAEYFNAGSLAEYGVFSFYLPQPGSLKDITFVETNLYSFRDRSGLSRLSASYSFTPQITGTFYVSGHWGDLGGVFHMPGQLAEAGMRMDVNF